MKFRWLALGCALGFALCAHAQDVKKDSRRDWIERPWEFRYILIVDDPLRFGVVIELSQENIKGGKLFIARPHAIFSNSVRTIQVHPPGIFNKGALKTLLIEFTEKGEVITPHTGPVGLAGHLNAIRSIVLAAGDGDMDRQFLIGDWYTGRGSGESSYIPAICTQVDMERRYVKGFKSDSINGGFGCREWGYYLRSDEHPYIDVTSYEKQSEVIDETDPVTGKSKVYSTYSHIRPVLGWGRFDVPPKPVIGNFENTWVCLHECPDGDAPGPIPDIKAWATKRGWALPKRPKKQPMFPDPDRKPGEFDD
jgi:hypothetical protein